MKISVTVSASLGASKKAVSANVGLGATIEYSWKASGSLAVNRKNKKKYVRAIMASDAYRWNVKKVMRYKYSWGDKVTTKKGYLYKPIKGSEGVELEYSNVKKS